MVHDRCVLDVSVSVERRTNCNICKIELMIHDRCVLDDVT